MREYGPVCAFLLPGCCLRHTFVGRPPADPAGAVRDALAERGPGRVVGASSNAVECRVQLAGEGCRADWTGRSGGFNVNARSIPPFAARRITAK